MKKKQSLATSPRALPHARVFVVVASMASASARCRFCGEVDAVAALVDPGCACYKKRESDLCHRSCLRERIERASTGASDGAADASRICETCGMPFRVDVVERFALTTRRVCGENAVATGVSVLLVVTTLATFVNMSYARAGTVATVDDFDGWRRGGGGGGEGKWATAAVVVFAVLAMLFVRKALARWKRQQTEVVRVDVV